MQQHSAIFSFLYTIPALKNLKEKAILKHHMDLNFALRWLKSQYMIAIYMIKYRIFFDNANLSYVILL